MLLRQGRAGRPRESWAADVDPRREHRWCERRRYFIDVEACQARTLHSRSCRRCLHRWRQLSLPLEPIG